MSIKTIPRIYLSDRVVFVPPTRADLPEVYPILSHPKVMQYVTTGARSKKSTEMYIDIIRYQSTQWYSKKN